ncbi:PAS domain-containing protein [Desulfovibrio sp. JC010]|uniref:PAS domain-containing protein n=1 Tax=Desulfovibrio sp. JC010 TaxID=2593641 RepID=UPI0013D7095F|nr:PAS domain-containing protein [Desulfovibrio sp. JC010]NDV27684.1 PAS domain S-box protein [Desulfovibrio sp. JC010]
MTFEELIAITEQPVVIAGSDGIIVKINTPFSREFGWQEADLAGRPLTAIIPSALRDAHQLGFSAFLSTGKASLLGQTLDLEIEHKDGSATLAEHFILSGLIEGKQRFAARIVPRS